MSEATTPARNAKFRAGELIKRLKDSHRTCTACFPHNGGAEHPWGEGLRLE
jgi:hypothetical protein